MYIYYHFLVVTLSLQLTLAFIALTGTSKLYCNIPTGTHLYMGRASVVRADTKCKTDSEKSKVHNRFAKRIIMAVKAGGGDPNVNKNLELVLAEARQWNVPKHIINRNIESASIGKSLNYKERCFEFIGIGGLTFVVDVLTDNENRAVKEVRSAASVHGLKAATLNSVLFKFERKSLLAIGSNMSEEAILNVLLKYGIDCDYEYVDAAVNDPVFDLNNNAESTILIIPTNQLLPVRDALKAESFEVQHRMIAVPKSKV